MFQLLNPFLLIGLIAMAIPIAIHIISRHRAKVVPFGSIVFLEQSVRERVGIKRLQELLTLLLRCLLILFLVLAASKPLLKRSKGRILGAGTETDIIIVLDNSVSMGYREGESTRFGRAKKLAGTVIEGLAAHDRAIILTTEISTERRPTWDDALPEAAQKRRSEAELSHGSQSCLFALNTALDLMHSAVGAVREIHLLSDFQSTALDHPEILKRVQTAKTHASVYAIQVAQARGQNTAVAEVALLEPFPLAGRPITVQTRLHNYGDKPTTETVLLAIDGKRQTKREVSIEPGQSQSIGLPHTFESPGRYRVEISLQDDDPLPADNARHLPVVVHEAMPILIVDGGDLRLGQLSESFFLQVALAPEKDRSRAALKPKTVTVDTLVQEKLDAYPILILANVPAIDDDAAKRLEKAVRKGTNLAIFLGERVQPNRAPYTSDGLFPLELGEQKSTSDALENEFALQVVHFAHPIFRRFRRGEAGDLSRVRFRQYWQLLPKPDSQAAVLAKFKTGDPALIEHTSGRGKVLIFASKCDADWSDFPRRTTYLPFLQQLIDYLSPARTSGQELLVGQQLSFDFEFKDTRVPIAIEKPDGTTARVVASGREKAEATFQETGLPGPYLLDIFSPEGLQEGIFVVNLDTSESDPEPADRDLLSNLVPGRTTFVPDASDLAALLKRHREGVELWGNLLVLVILIALVECYFANRSTPVA